MKRSRHYRGKKLILAGVFLPVLAVGGPYSQPMADDDNAFDAPVPGFVGPHGDGRARLQQSADSFLNPGNFVNPLFLGWATGVSVYSPASNVTLAWANPDFVLGPVTGDHFDVTSLGDLNSSQISQGALPGRITLTFSAAIKNKSGADFVVFENGIISAGGAGAGVAGEIFGELAYVEVSSDGTNFVRFPNFSLTLNPVGTFGTMNATNVFGLAGKHANANGQSWGTPFDLEQLSSLTAVVGGLVNLNAITHVRLVDIPGTGAFLDSANNPIYDASVTMGSGGFDLEAVGVISRSLTFGLWQDLNELTGGQRGELADPDQDGIPNLLEYAFALLPKRADDRANLFATSLEEGRLVFTFRRDERAEDVIYEVEVSSDLSTWQTIARSTPGGELAPVFPFAPLLEETSASAIRGIGVVRSVSVHDVVSDTGQRFMRARITR